MEKYELFGLTADKIAEEIKPFGLQKYRGRQIAEWFYHHFICDFGKMTNLPQDIRLLLEDNFLADKPKVLRELIAADGATCKFLLGLSDGAAVETVLMRHKYGNSVCVSTQVGCAMGCIFCASAIGGFSRNLTTGEIMGQILRSNEYLKTQNSSVNSVVIMGTGEPLLNYDNVINFIKLCHQEYCLNMSYRSFTLSTAGIVPGIDRLAAENLPITLAISLHAPDNALRSRLMPINHKYPLDEVLAAADRYASTTGRRVTYEYTLIKGLNDSEGHARQLSAILRGKLANVNLIPVNPVAERSLMPPAATGINKFMAILRTGKINVTLRREMGGDIKAACGQLRRTFIDENRGDCH